MGRWDKLSREQQQAVYEKTVLAAAEKDWEGRLQDALSES